MHPLIGLLGGSFDPIHKGHCSVADSLSRHLPFQSIHFMPCCEPVHRPPLKASPQHRLAMVKLAIEGRVNWVADSVEIERGGASYTLDTLKRIREHDKKLAYGLIITTETLRGLMEWESWESLVMFCHVIITSRPGYVFPTNKSPLVAWCRRYQVSDPKALLLSPSGKIFCHTLDRSINVSSTVIRGQLARHQVPKHLDKRVFEYIRREGLYKYNNVSDVSNI